MTLELIEQNTKQLIGTITLEILPLKNDYVKHKNALYLVYSIVHSETGIKLNVLEAGYKNDEIVTDWE